MCRSKAVLLNGRDISDEVLTFGKDEQSLSGLVVVLTDRPTAVCGSVQDERGRHVDQYAVVVFPTDADRWHAGSRFMTFTRAQGDGRFSVSGLPSADYFVAAVNRLQAAPASGEWLDPAVLSTLIPGATRISLLDGQTIQITPRLIVR